MYNRDQGQLVVPLLLRPPLHCGFCFAAMILPKGVLDVHCPSDNLKGLTARAEYVRYVILSPLSSVIMLWNFYDVVLRGVGAYVGRTNLQRTTSGQLPGRRQNTRKAVVAQVQWFLHSCHRTDP